MMSVDWNTIFANSFFPVFKNFLAPFVLWTGVPGLITGALFRNKSAAALGAFLGLICLIKFGHFGL